jgi:hypothetical protein
VASSRDLRRVIVGWLSLVLAAAAVLVLPATAEAAPTSPGGLSPSGTSATGVPTLEWGRVSGAATYDVELSASSTFGQVLFTVNTANRRAVPTVAMPTGEVFWRVRGRSSAGTAGSWSSASFNVSQGAGPVLASPADGASMQQPNNPVVLSWQPVPAAKAYEFEVDNDPDFVGAASATVSTTSYLIQNPQPTTTFYWRVRGVHAGGSVTRWSQTWHYSIPGLPEIDSLSVAPANSPDTRVEDIVLDWDPVPGAKDYDIRVSSDRNFSPTATVYTATVKSTRYSPPITYDNDQYWWQVRARDVLGNVRPWTDFAAIPLRQFERHWPDVPVVSYPTGSPENGPTPVGDPFFYQWEPVDHASHYQLQVSTTLEFSPTTFVSCTTSATTYTPTKATPHDSQPDCMPTPGRTYYWRVRGLDGPNVDNAEGGVIGRWSGINTFEYQPQRVDQLFPLPGEVVDVPTLRWSAAQDAEKYRVVITDNNGATQATTTRSLSWTPPVKLDSANGPFHWSIVAVDYNGYAQPTPTLGSQPTFSLTGAVETTGAASLTPLGPDGDSVHARFPDLRWEPHPQATSYKVYVGAAGSQTVTPLTDQNGSTVFTRYPSITDVNASFLRAGRYRWYVEAYNGSAPIEEGPDGYFRIADLAPVTGQKVALSGLDADTKFCANRLDAPDGQPTFCSDLKQTPVLDWSPVPNASHYLVYLYHDRALTNDVYPGVDYVVTQNTRWTPRSLLPDSQAGSAYYWFVRPCKAPTACAPDPLEASHAFDKRSNPVEPVLTEPTHDPTPANELTLHWQDYLASNAASPDSTGAQVTVEAQKYRVQISDDPTFTKLLHERVVDQTTYTPYDETFPEGPLYWRVQAIDGTDNELPWSDVDTREPVKVDKDSGAPTLAVPADDTTTDGTPFLGWRPLEYASAYDVEISTDRLFSPARQVLFATTKQSAYSLRDQLAASSTYWWRVRRVDAGGLKGSWSSAQSFRVTGQEPRLLSPSAGAYVESNDGYFTWDTVPGATSYTYELRQGTGTPAGATTYAQEYATRGDLANGTWSWRVVSNDASGRSLGVSAWRTFQVDSQRPTVRKRTPGRRSTPSANWVVTFSEPVRRVSATTMRLNRAGRAGAVRAHVTSSNSGRTWTLNPSTAMARRTRYTLRLSSGITDKAGNRLRATSYSSRVR